MEKDPRPGIALGMGRLRYRPAQGNQRSGNVDEVVIILSICGRLTAEEIARRRNEELRPSCGRHTSNSLLNNDTPTTTYTVTDLRNGVEAGYLETDGDHYWISAQTEALITSDEIGTFRPYLACK